MKFAALALLAPLVLSAAPAPDGKPLDVHIGGRAVVEGKAIRFGWPGVYVEGRFRGTEVNARVETQGDWLRVSVDGKPFQTLVTPGPAVVKVARLKPGIHTIRIDKLTESQSGSSRFLGFFTHGTPLAPPVRLRRIEFIGDSHSVGYGNTSPTRECDERKVHDTTDTSQAFGPVLARRLGADYRIVAYSGYGVVRNYAGGKPGENLPFLYLRAIPGEPAPARADGWRPGIIVINLGTNDFSTKLHPGEAWADDAALRAAYRKRYIDFVKERRRQQPQARLVLMGAENFYADVAAVARATGVTAVKVPTLEMTGCNWHPSLKDHRTMADLLAAALKTPGR
ncbi:SGNH/GDSL hydrolase family protein [Sphingomonas kyeonggiensis]|uniref:Lysophospholipase L1-like esterase n=1 Tax=Sphingomonas kyeonggiensis TaxID=1268553 RepID=A0A7W6JV77_9SPHN|nr:SGNH/GDSL hydrolase family protein [Sphingomonas kyeonggiensis]MBB4100105.1 lysophospholipase L1-like esterase [Sphingomonas kyeonggiensis]